MIELFCTLIYRKELLHMQKLIMNILDLEESELENLLTIESTNRRELQQFSLR